MSCDVPIPQIILLLMSLTARIDAQRWPLSGSCAPCKCSISDRGNERVRSVDCINLHLKEIPSNLPEDLDVLDFTNNNLPSKNVKGIQKFTFLQYLSLANNNITTLDDSPFSRSPLLTTVTLTGNSITKLTQEAFEGLQNLKILHGLKTELAEAQVFQYLPQLGELDLEIISPEIPEKIFDGLMVHSLNLTLVRATQLPHNLFAFGSNTLKNLRLIGPTVKDLRDDLLKGLTFLKTIYLELPSITHLPEGLFSNFLTTDTVSNNKPSNLQEIHLVLVQNLPVGIFNGLEHLVTLEIKKAEELPTRYFFNSLVNLQVLDLSHSFISRIPVNWFVKLNNLVSLNVSHTSLRKLNKESFTGLNQLKTLDLSFNSLRIIPEDVFTPLRNTLENLDLSENILKNIETSALHGMYSLKTLNLGDNKMSSLQKEIFKDLIRLSDLNIQENKLSSLPNEMFHSQQRLNKLNLASNSFSSFPQALLEVSGLLIHLDLSHNQIRDFGYCLEDKFPFLEFLSLDFNPLHCNCHILKLKESHPNLHLLGICANPKEFTNHPVNTILMPDRCSNITCDSTSVDRSSSILPELTVATETSSSLSSTSEPSVFDPAKASKTEPFDTNIEYEMQTPATENTMYDLDLPSLSLDVDDEVTHGAQIEKNPPSSDNTYFYDDTSNEEKQSESFDNNTNQIETPSSGNEKSQSIFDRIEFKVVIGVLAGCAFLVLFAIVVYLKKKHYKKSRFVFSPAAQEES